ncbi:hypothetical protein RRG08_030806 [Elysia crispata]|uniref:Uncharacterized protein n=1 Tax=Elysia crispata TaxID=231223 RepID=A0AAE0YF74_9GAST|nr:hypothetical protein RRG08_030806 [Elysia crispata]
MGQTCLMSCRSHPAGRNKIRDRVNGEQRFVSGYEVRRYLRSDTGDEDNPDPLAVDLTQRSTEDLPQAEDQN